MACFITENLKWTNYEVIFGDHYLSLLIQFVDLIIKMKLKNILQNDDIY